MSIRPLDPLIYSLVEMFEGDDISASEIYHESTKLTPVTWQAINRRIDAIRHNPALLTAMKRSWKTYPGCRTVALPEPHLGPMPMEEAIMRRRSHIGCFSDEPITAAQLSAVLKFGGGTTNGGGPNNMAAMHLRAAASAGGLHPLDLYAIVRKVDGIAPAIYHYDVLHHGLEVVKEGDFTADLLERGMGAGLLTTAAVVVAITGTFRRNTTKYLHRGYRFVSYDCGAVTQNLYLAATALDLGCCAIGGFYDNEMGELIGADNVDENVLLLFAVGGKTETPTDSSPQPGPVA